MTEAEWRGSADPTPMLETVLSTASDRKLRLFAVACCRRIACCVPGPWCHASLDVAEQVADGQASDAERSIARKDAQRAAQVKGTVPIPTSPKWERRAASAVYYAAAREAREAAWNAGQMVVESLVWKAGGHGQGDTQTIQTHEHRQQAALLRAVFGNPFQPVVADPRWLTSSVVALAAAIYEGRAFDRLPVLADALEEAGCDNEDVLDHCRGEGPHARGCWVVDLVLGKT